MEQQQEDRFVDELNMVSKTNIIMHETVIDWRPLRGLPFNRNSL